MPYAVASDNVRLYYEEVGSGTPILFVHEFAADHTNWEPQMRYFSRGHRCIAYAARGYTPSDVPPSPDLYTYKHFYTDALAVLDHLNIQKAHFVGLSMGSYSSLHVALNAPSRMLSMTLAGVGSWLKPRTSGCLAKAVSRNRRPVRKARRDRSRNGDARSAGADPLPDQGPARARRFLCGAGAPRFQGVRQHHAQLSGRPALDLHAGRGDPEGADAGPDHLRR